MIIRKFMARRENGEACSICLKLLKAGQWAIRTEITVVHFKCAKKKGWNTYNSGPAEMTKIFYQQQNLRKQSIQNNKRIRVVKANARRG